MVVHKHKVGVFVRLKKSIEITNVVKMFQHTAGSFNILHLFIFHSCQQLEKCRTILSLLHKTFVLYPFRPTYHVPCCTNYYDTSNSLIYICF